MESPHCLTKSFFTNNNKARCFLLKVWHILLSTKYTHSLVVHSLLINCNSQIASLGSCFPILTQNCGKKVLLTFFILLLWYIEIIIVKLIMWITYNRALSPSCLIRPHRFLYIFVNFCNNLVYIIDQGHLIKREQN